MAAIGYSGEMNLSLPDWMIDHPSKHLDHGYQIDWQYIKDNAPAALLDYYTKTANGCDQLCIPTGTVMVLAAAGSVDGVGETYMYPRWIDAGNTGAYGLLIGTACENAPADALTGYGIVVGGVVADNVREDYYDIAGAGKPAVNPNLAAWKAEFVTNGAGFRWRNYTNQF